MVMYGYQWLCMVINGYQWLSLVIYDYVWLSLVMCGYLWLCVVMYGYQWLFMIMYGYHWLCVVIYGYVWLCMVINGYLWLYFIAIIISLYFIKINSQCPFFNSRLYRPFPHNVAVANVFIASFYHPMQIKMMVYFRHRCQYFLKPAKP